MSTGKALFPSVSEVDQLFKIFRLLGTPTREDWPEVENLPYFQHNFPSFFPRSLAEELPLLPPDAHELLLVSMSVLCFCHFLLFFFTVAMTVETIHLQSKSTHNCQSSLAASISTSSTDSRSAFYCSCYYYSSSTSVCGDVADATNINMERGGKCI